MFWKQFLVILSVFSFYSCNLSAHQKDSDIEKDHLEIQLFVNKMKMFVNKSKAGSISFSHNTSYVLMEMLRSNKFVLYSDQEKNDKSHIRVVKSSQLIAEADIQKLKMKPEYAKHSPLLIAMALRNYLEWGAVYKITIQLPDNNEKAQEIMHLLQAKRSDKNSNNYEISFINKDNVVTIAAQKERNEARNKIDTYLEKFKLAAYVRPPFSNEKYTMFYRNF
jgi:hypothetical protein